jgi:hypothetical protein
VQLYPLPLGVGEGYLPLSELADVEVHVVVGGASGSVHRPDVGRGVPAVAYVHGQKGDRVRSLRCEVVQGADQSLAAVGRGSVEDRVARPPVPRVGREGMLRSRGVVEAGVAQPVLRTVGVAPDPVRSVAELQVMSADVLRTSLLEEAPGIRNWVRHLEGARGAIESRRGAGRGIKVDRNVRTAAEGCLIAPDARCIGRKARPPHLTGTITPASVEEPRHGLDLAGRT